MSASLQAWCSLVSALIVSLAAPAALAQEAAPGEAKPSRSAAPAKPFERTFFRTGLPRDMSGYGPFVRFLLMNLAVDTAAAAIPGVLGYIKNNGALHDAQAQLRALGGAGACRPPGPPGADAQFLCSDSCAATSSAGWRTAASTRTSSSSLR